jgi:hypothetical protein
MSFDAVFIKVVGRLSLEEHRSVFSLYDHHYGIIWIASFNTIDGRRLSRLTEETD